MDAGWRKLPETFAGQFLGVGRQQHLKNIEKHRRQQMSSIWCLQQFQNVMTEENPGRFKWHACQGKGNFNRKIQKLLKERHWCLQEFSRVLTEGNPDLFKWLTGQDKIKPTRNIDRASFVFAGVFEGIDGGESGPLQVAHWAGAAVS